MLTSFSDFQRLSLLRSNAGVKTAEYDEEQRARCLLDIKSLGVHCSCKQVENKYLLSVCLNVTTGHRLKTLIY